MYRKEPVITSPWGGWNNENPSMVQQPTSFRQIVNTLIDKGRLQSLPWKTPFDQNTAPITFLGLRTFQDTLGSYHTLGLGTNGVYYYDPSQAVGSRWVKLQRYEIISNSKDPLDGVSAGLPCTNPFAMETFANRVYFTDGVNTLSYVTGDAGWYRIRPNGSNSYPGASYFLGKLAQKLLMINCIEPSPEVFAEDNFTPVVYPNRVRWSQTINPLVWDPAQDLSAGFQDVFDVEDGFTGYATLGVTGFLFRTNGITAMSATGLLDAPFRFENFSIGPKGIGCNISYTLAVYGPFCAFLALDDIYYFDGSSAPVPIGKAAKRSIFKDVATSSSQCSATMVGALYPGRDFMSYWLFCPQNNDTLTSVWVYNFNSSTWVNLQLLGAVRSFENVATS